jgi:hypothetical protein
MREKNPKKEGSLPEFLFHFFWEYDPITIDVDKHSSLIMGRIMERGSWAAMSWLRETYSKDQLVAFLENKGIRSLPPRELNYWALICDMSFRKRQDWLKETRQKTDVWRNRYLQ